MPTCSSSTSAGRTSSAVFLNMDEQFLALVEDDTADGNDDSYRHFDLVVDDRDAVTQHLKDARIERLSTGGLDFLIRGAIPSRLSPTRTSSSPVPSTSATRWDSSGWKIRVRDRGARREGYDSRAVEGGGEKI